MSLSTLLLKLLGPPLTRAILTIVFRDEISGGDMAETLTDSLDIPGFIGRLTDNNARAQRNGDYLFRSVGEETAEALTAVFELEGDALAPAQQELVIQAVADTLSQHTLPLLITHNFQRDPFRQALLDLPLPTILREEVSHTFYRRLLAQCSHRLFALADKLPGFNRDTTAQQLQNHNQTHHMLGELQQAISDLTHIYQTSQIHNPAQTAATFEQDYRTLLAQDLDRLTLFGVPQIRDYQQPLSVAYISLTITKQVNINGARSEELNDELLSDKRSLSMLEALTQSKRLLLVGRAGSGKTTLLKWIAVQTARQNQEGIPANWADKLPIFLRLRDFAQTELPSIETLALQSGGVRDLKGRLPQNWTDQQLRQGRALLLIDGLDEVSQEKREAAYTWLERTLTLYPNAGYIISSRPNTLQDEIVAARLQRNGFLRLDLQDINQEAIKQFIDRWHKAMADERCLLPIESKVALPHLADKLNQALQQQPRLRDLARNPLLCALLCALHQARRSQLPDDRIQLYQACLDMLLEGRDLERGIDIQDYGINLNLRQKQRLLASLAYWMMRNNTPVISQAEAIRELGRGETNGAAVLRLLLERSGLLQAQTANSYDFAHRTFQEYLAAQEIIYRGDIRFVCHHYAFNEEWIETLRLTAGVMTTERDQVTLLQQLQKQVDFSNQSREIRRLHILAMECFSMMVTPTNKVLTEANAHALGLVEQNRRLRLRETAISNLMPFSSLTQIKTLDLVRTNVSDLSPLSSLEQLKRLYLNQTAILDISPLSSLSTLCRLDFNQTAISDISPVSSLTQLQELHLRQTPVSDLSPFSSLTQLCILDLYSTNVWDLSPLSSLTQLKQLYLGQTDVSVLSPLSSLVQLQELSLIATKVSDLSPLSPLSQLQKLYLSETLISDLSSLSGLKQLRDLSLLETAISDISPITSLTQLKRLNLEQTHISDLSPLSSLTQLHYLDLGYIDITDFACLSLLANLQLLTLPGTPITDLSFLSTLKQLQVLDLRETQVTDFSPLLSLPSLKAIWVSNPALLPPFHSLQVTINPGVDPHSYLGTYL